MCVDLTVANELFLKLVSLRPKLAHAAQQEYDAWNQEDEDGDLEFGHGGICDAIASAISGAIVAHIEDIKIEEGGWDGDDHAYIIAFDKTEAYAIDIPHHVYEVGGGMSWHKIHNVEFEPDDVHIWPINLADLNESMMLPTIVSRFLTESPDKLYSENPFSKSVIRQPVYHGTEKLFKTFEYQKSQRFVMFAQFDVEARGFFFSESEEDARSFGNNVAVCFVNMARPLIDPRQRSTISDVGLSDRQEIDMMKILAPLIKRDEKGHYIDYMITRNYLQHERRPTERDWIYDAIDSGGLVWDVLDEPGVVHKMTALGYDGTFVHEPDTSQGRSIFITFSDQVQIIDWV
jgi:hypothetical protein